MRNNMADETKRDLFADSDGDKPDNVKVTIEGEVVNASGHRDQLQRGYGFLSICGLALTVDNAWVAIGTSLSISIYNGGPPGVLYEFLVAIFYYSFIAASIAELASSIPSAGGVYHWASVTPGPRYSRVVGFFGGFVNFFGWLFDLASIVYIMAELVVQMYFLYHPDYVIKQWHTFVTLVALTWICIAVTVFLNRFLPALQQLGLFVVTVGGLVSIIVLAAMPSKYSTNSFVWKDFENGTGWPGGIAFLTGVLNGAFTIGTTDGVCHIAEELPNPRRDLPRAILAQMSIGSVFAFTFAITLFYGINNHLGPVLNSNGSFPLAAAYLEATGSKGATFGLLFIIFLSLTSCLIGTFLTVGRTWWALARDNATPFPKFFSSVNERLSCPIPATVFTGLMTTAFGAITLGSATAFQDLAGSFIVVTSTSYIFAILPHILSGRKNIPRGSFWMGSFGMPINIASVVLIVFFNVMFCLPYVNPTTVQAMNYNSVILVGVLTLVTIWWFAWGHRYPGTKVKALHS